MGLSIEADSQLGKRRRSKQWVGKGCQTRETKVIRQVFRSEDALLNPRGVFTVRSQEEFACVQQTQEECKWNKISETVVKQNGNHFLRDSVCNCVWLTTN